MRWALSPNPNPNTDPDPDPDPDPNPNPNPNANPNQAAPRTAAARETFARADAAVAAAAAASAAKAAAASGAPAPAPKLQMTPEVLKPSKIQRGDYVIHKAFGIGRFEGLYKKREITIQWDDDGNEFEFQAKFLRVKFKDGDLELRLPDREHIKLFKRKAEEDMEGIAVNLDSMRSRRSWEKRKAKATAGVFAVAADLLKMYAERQARYLVITPRSKRRRPTLTLLRLHSLRLSLRLHSLLTTAGGAALALTRTLTLPLPLTRR